MEQEIERLQMPRRPSEELLQMEKPTISLQGIESWCVDSEGNLVLMDSPSPEVIKSNPMDCP